MHLQRSVIFLTLLLIIVAAWILFAPATHKELRAEAFELVTSDGTVVAVLESRKGYPTLALKDEAGVDRVSLFHGAEGSGLYVLDGAATTRIGIAQFAHGGGGVALHGAESKGALVMYYKKSGSVRFFDHAGTII
ncbi:MAG: hypothetical protein OEO82_12465, partial [Gammaproteobacteria bacterium]|nr:hypothetical protein [Gammaproteobacteria bacterium]